MDNKDKDIEIIFALDNEFLQDILQEVRDNNRIPIIQTLDIEFDWDYERLANGFELDELEVLLESQIKFENYEGASFIKEILEGRDKDLIIKTKPNE